MAVSIMPLAALAGALAVYISTLCPTVYVEGSGELIGAAYWLGTPHPTGYPLFCLSGRLVATLLPFAGPAYEINFASALFAAAACGVLALWLQERGLQGWVALTTSLVFAFSRTFWSQAVIAEVYGQALLLVFLVCLQGVRASERRTERDLLLLAWLMGLGLTAHLMQVLVWPGLVALLVWRWFDLIRRPLLVAKAVLAGLGGYSLVAYLPLRNGRGPGFHWDPIDGPDALWQHLTGAIYRSSFFSLPLEGMVLNAERWGGQVLDEFHPLLIPVLLWGVHAAWRRDRSVFIVAGGAIGANLVAALNYHRDPNGLPVFFMLSLAGLVVFMGFGLDDLVRRAGRFGRSWALVPACATVVGAVLTTHYATSDRSANRIAETYGRDILDDLPEDAQLITEGDDAAFVLDYLLRVEKVRPGITLYNRVGRGMDLLTWEEHGYGPADQDRLRLRREAELARGPRPLFYLVARRAPLPEGEFQPWGLVYRLIANPGQLHRKAPGPQIEMANALAKGFHRDSWVRKLQSNYWFMAGEQRRYTGDRSGAIAAYEQAAKVAFDSRSTRFNVALKLFNFNELDRARTHAEAARGIDPWKPQPYRLMAHIHRKEGRMAEARKLLKKAGELQQEP